jgi:Zn-finger nucleic acid-binding protein
MNCPTCKSAMITLELAEVEVDHCVHCGGIWLDTGELEVLMDDPVKAKLFRRTPPPRSSLAGARSAREK